jgi:hypothetical protein
MYELKINYVGIITDIEPCWQEANSVDDRCDE